MTLLSSVVGKHVTRSSAKCGGKCLGFFVSGIQRIVTPSIQHCLRGGGKRFWSRRVLTLWTERIELCLAEVAEIVGNVVSHLLFANCLWINPGASAGSYNSIME